MQPQHPKRFTQKEEETHVILGPVFCEPAGWRLILYSSIESDSSRVIIVLDSLKLGNLMLMETM